MKVAADFLAAKLKAACGPGTLEGDPGILGRYGVDGKIPKLLLLPDKVEHISEALRACAEAEASVIPWGGGTCTSLGNIPREVDIIISLERMDRMVEHDDANLTATVQAGMRTAALQEILARKSQFVAIDPPHPARATIGGVVAANINGPRRNFYGGVRDLVIGMKMVLATGERIKAGGKVVKNVAGYDMCKLFVGSLGTLGIITEVTIRMAPVPESAATILAQGSLDRCQQLVDDLSGSTLLPAAMALLSGDVAKAAGVSPGTPSVTVWVEGFAESVRRHLKDIQTMSERAGLTTEVLYDVPHRRLWETVRDFGTNGEGILYRVTVPLASMGELVKRVEEREVSGSRARYVAHPGAGTLWLLLEASPSGTASFGRLAALAQKQGGHAIMVAAPPALKNGLDVWGNSPSGLLIMREIKRQFDPQGILNPGRFVAGL